MSIISSSAVRIFPNVSYIKKSMIFTGTLYEFTRSGYFQLSSDLTAARLFIWAASGGEDGKSGARYQGGEGGMGGEYILQGDMYNIIGNTGGIYTVTIGNDASDASGNRLLNRDTFITSSAGNSFRSFIKNSGKGGQYGGNGDSFTIGLKTYYFSGGGGSGRTLGSKGIGRGSGLLLAKNGEGIYAGSAGAGYGGGGGGGDVLSKGGAGARGVVLLLDINSVNTGSPPSEISIIYVQNFASNNFTINWLGATGATNYLFLPQANSYSIQNKSAVFTKLLPNTNYTLTITALNTYGSVSSSIKILTAA
jgi:hypothetical protein